MAGAALAMALCRCDWQGGSGIKIPPLELAARSGKWTQIRLPGENPPARATRESAPFDKGVNTRCLAAPASQTIVERLVELDAGFLDRLGGDAGFFADQVGEFLW